MSKTTDSAGHTFLPSAHRVGVTNPPTLGFVMLLLRMRTGSHLYGTNHAGSDEDFCEVYDRLPGRRQAAQSISGDQDIIRLGLKIGRAHV